jgi:hypothetical protein
MTDLPKDKDLSSQHIIPITVNHLINLILISQSLQE